MLLRACRRASIFNQTKKSFEDLRLAEDFVHACAAYGASSFGSFHAIFHRDLFHVFHLTILLTLHATTLNGFIHTFSIAEHKQESVNKIWPILGSLRVDFGKFFAILGVA